MVSELGYSLCEKKLHGSDGTVSGGIITYIK